jgi:hypothetical protein
MHQLGGNFCHILQTNVGLLVGFFLTRLLPSIWHRLSCVAMLLLNFRPSSIVLLIVLLPKEKKKTIE